MVSHLDRVVQIAGRDADNRPYFVASGLLLVGDLAITAAHAVRDTEARYEVRPVGQTRLTARLRVLRVVPHPGRDLALLVLEADRGALPPLRFAELPYDIGQIKVHAVGFPRFALEDSRPRSHQINATIQLGSDRTGHQLQLSVHSSEPPPAAPSGSPWAGYSGAGILTEREGLLAGIATSHRPSGDRKNTTGTDLCDLRDPAFLDLLAAHGVEATPLAVRPSSTATTPHWLPPSICAVLARQREAADELPHRFRQDRRPRRLTAVYVRQLLSRSDARDEKTSEAKTEQLEAAGLAKHTASAGPPRPLNAVLTADGKSTGHLLVEAGPGAGKSTLLHGCALDFGHEALASPTPPGQLVPLWVTATQLTEAGHSLESAVAAATGLDTGDGTLPRLPDGARWLVLVDALDEVHHDRRSRLIHRLADQAADAAATRLRMLVTTRPDPEGTAELSRAGFQRYALDPFDRSRLEEFAHAWFEVSGRPDLAPEFLRQIDDADLGDLLRNPLLATVTVVVFEQAPDRPLPDNRWALYEQYRVHLHATKSEQVEELWRDLTARAAGTRHGRDAVQHLRENIEELLGRLAHAQIADGAWDLPGIAHRWWEETAVDAQGRRFGAVPPLDDWRGAITDALLGTGMFVRRGRDLEFLHTTFTEHLAAERLAHGLPDSFDPGSHQWRTTIVAASGRTGHPLWQLYRTALVHYGHRHRAGGQALLDWLQQGPDDDQLLAGELLAARCPAQEIHHQQFLAAVENLRSPDAKYKVWDLLSRMQNAKVRSYVARTARRTGPHRVLAAAALMDHDAQSAVESLQQCALDSGSDPRALQSAAEELAESYPEHKAAAGRILVALLSHPRFDTWDRADTAASLAALGDTYVDAAGKALMALIDATAPHVFGYDKAIDHLIELGGVYSREAARRIAQLPGSSTSAYRHLARVEELRALGADHLPAAAVILRAILTDPLGGSFDRSKALTVLAELGGPYVEEAAQTLRAIIAAPHSGAYDREQAIQQLAGLGEPYTGDAAGLIQAVVDDPRHSRDDRTRYAVMLADLGEQYAEQAAGALRALADDPEAPLADRLDAAQALSRLAGPGETEPVSAQDMEIVTARGVIADPGSPTAARLSAARQLADQGEPFVSEVARGLCSVLAESEVRGERDEAASLLREWGEPYLGDAEQSMRSQASETHTTDRSRLGAVRGLVAIGRFRAPADIALVRALITGPSTATDVREQAVETLREASEGYVEDFALDLRRVLAAPGSDAPGRRAAARTLMLLGSPHVQAAAAALHGDVTRPDASPRVRLDAARGLLVLGGPYVPVDTDLLRAIVAHRSTGPRERLRAVDVLLCLDREYAETAAQVLYEVATWPGIEPADFRRATELLLGLGEQCRSQALKALRTAIHRWTHGDASVTVMDDLGQPYSDAAAKAIRRSALRWWVSARRRREMASALSALADEHKPAAARILRGLIRRPWTDYFDRRMAAEDLAALGGTYPDMAAKALKRAWPGLRNRGYNRLELAEFLISLGQPYWPQAADVLVGVIFGQTSDAYDMGKAVDHLAGLGDEFRARAVHALHRAARGRTLRRYGSYDRRDAARKLAVLESGGP